MSSELNGPEFTEVDAPEAQHITRRSILSRAAAAGMAAIGTGMLAAPASADGSVAQDIAVLNFALNLEYLEAEYYTYATTGMGLSSVGIWTGNATTRPGGVTVKHGAQVPFSNPVIQQFAMEIAADEQAHVRLLQRAIKQLGGVPVSEPSLDLLNSFNGAAEAAGIGSSFDPFANDVSFLLGSFVFEDVGVTAYRGGAPLIKTKDVLSAAAGILGVEAYHAAGIRTMLLSEGPDVAAIVQKISNLRDSVDGSSDDDQGILGDDDQANFPNTGSVNIVPTDKYGLVYARNTRQVLNIVYLGGVHSGGFFPQGLNGVIY